MAADADAIAKILEIIADYRHGEIAAPTKEHVLRWVSQFPTPVRTPLLVELAVVWDKYYFTRNNILEYLEALAKNAKVAGEQPKDFWAKANFLRLQPKAHSQDDLLKLFGQALDRQYGLDLKKCGSGAGIFIYLDDVIFSGNRVGSDLCKWLEGDAPKTSEVHVIVVAYHRYGQYSADRRIKKKAAELGKSVKLHWWRCAEVEDTRTGINNSEVLRPCTVPDDPAVIEYYETVKGGQYPLVLRQPGKMVKDNVFGLETARSLIEEQMLIAGVAIRSHCENPRDVMKPLGYQNFNSFGFGSLVTTFRNCPNNAPLAIWWGDPTGTKGPPLTSWYPLLPRKPYDREDDTW